MKLILENWRSFLKEENTAQIQRASATGRSGPASYHDAIVVLEKGTTVEVLETKDSWAKVKTGDHTVWIHLNTLSEPPERKYKAISPGEAGDISPSPAGLAAGAKG